MPINNTTSASDHITVTAPSIKNSSFIAGTISTNQIVSGTIATSFTNNYFSIEDTTLPFNKLYILPFTAQSKISDILINHIKSINPTINSWCISIKLDTLNGMYNYIAVDIKYEDEVNTILRNFTKFYGNDYRHLLPHKEEISNVSIVNYDIDENHDAVIWLVENCTKQFYGIGRTSIAFESEIDLIAFKMKFL